MLTKESEKATIFRLLGPDLLIDNQQGTAQAKVLINPDGSINNETLKLIEELDQKRIPAKNADTVIESFQKGTWVVFLEK